MVKNGVNGIEATVQFQERLNGNIIITLNSDDTEEGAVHPAYILSPSVGNAEGLKVTFFTQLFHPIQSS